MCRCILLFRYPVCTTILFFLIFSFQCIFHLIFLLCIILWSIQLCFCISLKRSCLQFELMKFKSDKSTKPCTIQTIHVERHPFAPLTLSLPFCVCVCMYSILNIIHSKWFLILIFLLFFISFSLIYTFFNWIYAKQQCKRMAEHNNKCTCWAETSFKILDSFDLGTFCLSKIQTPNKLSHNIQIQRLLWFLNSVQQPTKMHQKCRITNC